MRTKLYQEGTSREIDFEYNPKGVEVAIQISSKNVADKPRTINARIRVKKTELKALLKSL